MDDSGDYQKCSGVCCYFQGPSFFFRKFSDADNPTRCWLCNAKDSKKYVEDGFDLWLELEEQTKYIRSEIYTPSCRKYTRNIQEAYRMAGKKDLNWGHRFTLALRHLGLHVEKRGEKDEHHYPNGNPTVLDTCYYPWWFHVWRFMGKGHTWDYWKKGDVIRWIPLNSDDGNRPLRIVASTIRGSDGWALVGIRHSSQDMQGLRERMKNPGNFWGRCHADMGFIDNYAIYRNRREGMIIAREAGQLFHVDKRCKHLWDGDELYSEMLY